MTLPAIVRNWLHEREERRAFHALQAWVLAEAKYIDLPTRMYHENVRRRP